MPSKRVVLTGSTGLVGSAIIEQASRDGELEIIPWYRNPSNHSGEHIVADLTVVEQWESQLSKIKPDILIHSAAQSHVDRCSNDFGACRQINVDATKKLVHACNAMGTHMIYISSDFVFDGKADGFHEGSPCEPVNQYGETKLEAETYVREVANSWSIVRTIMVYGVTNTLKRNNILTWVVNSLHKGQPITVVNDQFRMPTFSHDLAFGILTIAKRKHHGVFHLCGEEYLSVYEFACRIAKHYDLNESLIRPVSTAWLKEKNPRPAKTAFSLLKSRAVLNYTPTGLDESLKRIPLAQITSLNL
jgi:dTDP-4-dehydrorhamnose reductase